MSEWVSLMYNFIYSIMACVLTLTGDGFTTHRPQFFSFFLFYIFHLSSTTCYFFTLKCFYGCSYVASETLHFDSSITLKKVSCHSLGPLRPCIQKSRVKQTGIIPKSTFLTVRKTKLKGQNNRLDLWKLAVVLQRQCCDSVTFTDMINIIPRQTA